MRTIAGSCVAVAVLAISLGAPGCGAVAEEPAQDALVAERAEALGGAEVPFCYAGMRTEVTAVDPAAPRCTVAQLPEWVDFICGPGQPADVCNFVLGTLNGWGTVQCHWYVDEAGSSKACADRVAYYLDGSPLEGAVEGANYHAFYASDFYNSPSYFHWNAAMSNPLYSSPPVDLGQLMYIDKKLKRYYPWSIPSVPQSIMRSLRVGRFDPRDCFPCNYTGPGMSIISNPDTLHYPSGADEVASGWWPGFDPATCELEPFKGAHRVTPASDPANEWVVTSQCACTAEAIYRNVGVVAPCP